MLLQIHALHFQRGQLLHSLDFHHVLLCAPRFEGLRVFVY
jgi:hypothetical protein